MQISLVFPHQLFENNPCLSTDRPVWIVEDFLFFKQYTFHKHKLVLHRAAMKHYQYKLLENGFTVKYVESSEITKRSSLRELLAHHHVTHLHFCDVVDTWLSEDLAKSHIQSSIYETPMFLTQESELRTFFTKKKPFMKTFYEWQRKRLNILMEDGEPIGGKFSFDEDNRKKLPKDYAEPRQPSFTADDFLTEALHYVSQNFPNNYGDVDTFWYGHTHSHAQKALADFLEHRLHDFGIYEDAISSNHTTVNHSILTPYLNCGLITPHEVLHKTLAYTETHTIPLNSLEGFVRQIIGWREFMRAMYLLHGTTMRTKNFWNHTKKLPQEFYDATTGIDPLDSSINRALTHSYCHHIERLMVLGNYMVLNEYHPNDIYVWFIELFIDSYDWVMVPNVYAMSQFADGGIFATKPYISGSNYIIKMSNFKKGTWSKVWDDLFWKFLFKHETFFSKNPRINMLIHTKKSKLGS